MTMVGGAMFGYCATGRLVIAKAPASKMKMASTQAKTGRSIKNLPMTMLPYFDFGCSAVVAAGADGGVRAGAGLAGSAAGAGAAGAAFFHCTGLTVAPG